MFVINRRQKDKRLLPATVDIAMREMPRQPIPSPAPPSPVPEAARQQGAGAGGGSGSAVNAAAGEYSDAYSSIANDVLVVMSSRRSSVLHDASPGGGDAPAPPTMHVNPRYHQSSAAGELEACSGRAAAAEGGQTSRGSRRGRGLDEQISADIDACCRPAACTDTDTARRRRYCSV